MVAEDDVRAFKTAWFSKAAAKTGLSDQVLKRAIEQVMRGQADDLGGGVYKKRPQPKQAPFDHLGEGRQVLGVRLSVCEKGPVEY